MKWWLARCRFKKIRPMTFRNAFWTAKLNSLNFSKQKAGRSVAWISLRNCARLTVTKDWGAVPEVLKKSNCTSGLEVWTGLKLRRWQCLLPGRPMLEICSIQNNSTNILIVMWLHQKLKTVFLMIFEYKKIINHMILFGWVLWSTTNISFYKKLEIII